MPSSISQHHRIRRAWRRDGFSAKCSAGDFEVEGLPTSAELSLACAAHRNEVGATIAADQENIRETLIDLVTSHDVHGDVAVSIADDIMNTDLCGLVVKLA